MLASYTTLATQVMMPESIMPEQFFDANRPPMKQEQRLLLAILEDATNCLSKYAVATTPHGRRLFNDAYDWSMSSARDHLCTFEKICEALGIESSYMRKGLIKHFARYRSLKPTPLALRPKEPIKRRNFTVVVTCVREVNFIVVCRLADGRELLVPFRTIKNPENFPKPGQTGELVVSLHFARNRGLIPGAPPRIDTRRQAGFRRNERIFRGHDEEAAA